MSTRTTLRDKYVAGDPMAADVYRAEDLAAENAGLRRYRRFADLVAHVDRIVGSAWWDATFPDAPVDVHVSRRSRNATYSAALQGPSGADTAEIAIIDGRHWNASVVLHELAHIAAGSDARHGPVFRAALLALWRQEAGIVAAVELRDQLRATGFTVDLP